MGGVRPVAQGIEHQEVKALKALHRLVGDRIAVGDVGHPADAESRDGHLPVPDQQGLDDPSKELKRTGDLVRLGFGKGPVVVVEVENVPRDLSQGLKGLFGGVEGGSLPAASGYSGECRRCQRYGPRARGCRAGHRDGAAWPAAPGA